MGVSLSTVGKSYRVFCDDFRDYYVARARLRVESRKPLCGVRV